MLECPKQSIVFETNEGICNERHFEGMLSAIFQKNFSVTMALPCSPRLQQLQPEETNLGVCVICQGDFTIEVLLRLRKADCCKTLFHRRCFSQMLTHTSRCPACRHEHQPENPHALELPDDLDLIKADLEKAKLQLLIFNDPQGTFATLRFQAQVSEEIHDYRSRGLPVPHRPGSPFWPILPYFIPEHCFSLICLLLKHLLKPMLVIRCVYTDLLSHQFPFLLL